MRVDPVATWKTTAKGKEKDTQWQASAVSWAEMGRLLSMYRLESCGAMVGWKIDGMDW